MANLKELRSQIASVKSTQRITSAMKMVAAAKLRRASERAEETRSYAEKMESVIRRLTKTAGERAPEILKGNGRDETQLMVVVTSDRGLCGGFNGQMMREVHKRIEQRIDAGKKTKLIFVGRKGFAMLRREYKDMVVASHEELNKPQPNFIEAKKLAQHAVDMFTNNEVDSVVLYYTRFVSALTQVVEGLPLIPFHSPNDSDDMDQADDMVFDYEPDEETILTQLVPNNLSVQVYKGFLESFASEQGARMNAMDNATRNATDMINRLSVTYNRSRQAQITKELIEIISGAEAL